MIEFKRQKIKLGDSYLRITTEKARTYLKSDKGKLWKKQYHERSKELAFGGRN